MTVLLANRYEYLRKALALGFGLEELQARPKSGIRDVLSGLSK